MPLLVTLTDRTDPKRVSVYGAAATAFGHLIFSLFANGIWLAAVMRAFPGMGGAGSTGLASSSLRIVLMQTWNRMSW